MQIAAFPDGGDFPVEYSDSGKRINPAISWSDPPKGTVTFVLNFHDQNNARNKTTDDMLDWIVWNIPADARGLPEGVPPGPQLADGALQTSASGPGTYRGPGFTGGPTGMGAKHHYTFDLYALDIKLDVPVNGEPFDTRTKVFQEMQGHVLGKAVYMGLFRRPPGPEPAGSRTPPAR
jgi:Raf kinase inhibitor-like YbhB/YbcL family protein